MTIESAGNATYNPQPSSSPQAESPEGGQQTPQGEDAARQNDPGEWASRFASLTKTEKRILQQKKEMDSQRQEFEEFRRTKGLAKTNVPEFLKAHGLTYEQITDIMLKGDGPKTPEDPVALLQKQIDEDRAERQREKEAKENERVQSAIDTHKVAIRSHVDSLGDKYEIIAAEGAYDTVFDVIEEYWNENGELLPVDEACQLVDNYLTERAKKLIGLKRFRAQDSLNDDRPQHENRQPTGENFTLTNNAVAASPSSSSRNERISDEEAKRRAAAKIQWN